MVDGAAWKLFNFSTNLLQFATAGPSADHLLGACVEPIIMPQTPGTLHYL